MFMHLLVSVARFELSILGLLVKCSTPLKLGDNLRYKSCKIYSCMTGDVSLHVHWNYRVEVLCAQSLLAKPNCLLDPVRDMQPAIMQNVSGICLDKTDADGGTKMINVFWNLGNLAN
jgi:hypothetical protein